MVATQGGPPARQRMQVRVLQALIPSVTRPFMGSFCFVQKTGMRDRDDGKRRGSSYPSTFFFHGAYPCEAKEHSAGRKMLRERRGGQENQRAFKVSTTSQ